MQSNFFEIYLRNLFSGFLSWLILRIPDLRFPRYDSISFFLDEYSIFFVQLKTTIYKNINNQFITRKASWLGSYSPISFLKPLLHFLILLSLSRTGSYFFPDEKVSNPESFRGMPELSYSAFQTCIRAFYHAILARSDESRWKIQLLYWYFCSEKIITWDPAFYKIADPENHP
jgi:hypothetical protein